MENKRTGPKIFHNIYVHIPLYFTIKLIPLGLSLSKSVSLIFTIAVRHVDEKNLRKRANCVPNKA